MNFPVLSPEERKQRLAPPAGRVRAVIDSDTYNEVDDQFAIAYALMSPERLDVEALYAAPFSSAFQRAMMGETVLPMTDETAVAVEQSYLEMRKLLDLLELDCPAYRGSPSYMTDSGTPVESEAARDLVRRAHASPEPLYVIAIGEITNVASAILMDPSIIRKIVVVWLAGQPLHWPHALEFNLWQDQIASRLILDCGVPLVLVPCMAVASNLTVTAPELERHLRGQSRVGTYLSDIVTGQLNQEMGLGWLRLFNKVYCKGMDDYGPAGLPDTDTWVSPSRIIWDISAVAWAINPTWCPSTLVPTPWLTEDCCWRLDPQRHLMRVCSFVYRDAVFGDLFAKLSKAPK